MKKAEELRSHRWFGKESMRTFNHRSRMAQIGWEEADYRGKPGPDGEPPVEDLEKLARFRKMLQHEERQPHRLKDLAVDGSDLIAIGIAPGPELGGLLRDLLHDVVEDPSRNRKDELLRRARAKVAQ